MSANRALNGSEVSFTGEAVGDIVNADEGHKWVNIRGSSNSAISVYMPDDLAKLIQNVGDYHMTGTTLKITGTYHIACPEHEGELDVHASTAEVTDNGGPVTHMVAPGRLEAALCCASSRDCFSWHSCSSDAICREGMTMIPFDRLAFRSSTREAFENAQVELARQGKSCEPGCVVSLDRGYPLVCTREFEGRAELATSIKKSEDSIVAVGDWVALHRPPHHEKAVIERVLPRRNEIARVKRVGRERQLRRQVLAANVDIVLIWPFPHGHGRGRGPARAPDGGGFGLRGDPRVRAHKGRSRERGDD